MQTAAEVGCCALVLGSGGLFHQSLLACWALARFAIPLTVDPAGGSLIDCPLAAMLEAAAVALRKLTRTANLFILASKFCGIARLLVVLPLTAFLQLLALRAATQPQAVFELCF